MELCLSHSSSAPAYDDADCSLEALPTATIPHMWLGFFEGPAETARGSYMTLGPDEWSGTLGIRYVSVEQVAAVNSSSRLRTARKAV